MIGAVSALVFSSGNAEAPRLLARGTAAGGPRLISIAPLPEGAQCAWSPGGDNLGQPPVLEQGQESSALAELPQDQAARLAAQRKPVRVIRDPSPSFSSVAVDPIRNEVVFSDENLFQIMVYDRLANTAPTAAFSEPKRVIGGLETRLEYQCGTYIDPATGDIYSVSNDTADRRLKVYSRQAQGNVPPNRELNAPHGTFGIAVDEGAQELYLTIEHQNAIVVYKKLAKEFDSPIRLVQGDRTKLADPHGIALDTKNRLIFVTNHGHFHTKRPGGTLAGPNFDGRTNWPIGEEVPGSGRNVPPSITVYPLDARGDTPPLRTIGGPNTRLNWPSGISFDPKRDEIHIANDMGDEILVFSTKADGNVAPARIIRGPKTLIRNPKGVFLDAQNDELWVANFGNHTATVYSPTAAGDTPPLRVIRSAPLSAPAPVLGNPGALAYDTKREEILVPN
jgi:DNA-binding beta-propeller fold protein YncE